MRFDSRTANVLRKAARGPAAIALRQHRILKGARVPVNRNAGVLTQGGSAGVMRRGFAGLGDTGPSTTAQVETAVKGTAISVGSAATGAVAAGSLASAGAVAGSVVPIVGTAIGAVVGIIAGMLLKKNYLNVNDMNAHEDAEVAIWKQYQAIMGRVAGRQIGLDAMTAIMKGALHSGLWKGNQVRQCFHNGCSKYPGNASWIDALVKGGGRPDPDTFPLQIVQYRAWKATAAGRVNSIPDAVVFIDRFVIPTNKAHNSWVVPATATEHQILYDLADAYLAQAPGVGKTIPFVAAAPPAKATPMPSPAPQRVPRPVNIVPSRTGPGGATSAVPGYIIVNPTGFNGQPLYIRAADAGATGTLPAFATMNGQMTAVGTINATTPAQPVPLPATMDTGAGGAVIASGGGTAYSAPPTASPAGAAGAPGATGVAALFTNPVPLIVAALAVFGG